MAILVMADTHLSEGLDKTMDVFGHRWIGYTEKLVAAWRECVRDEDTVIVPGDVSWGMTLSDALEGLKLLNDLPGNKILGRGNHDYWWTTASKMNAFLNEYGLSRLSFLYNNAFLVEDKLIVGTRGWFYDQKISPRDTDFDKIVAREAGRLEMSIRSAMALQGAENATEMLCFLHFPPLYRDQICQPLINVMARYGIRRCYYGHIHGVYDQPATVTRDGIDFRLISADFLSFRPHKIDDNREGSENIRTGGLTIPE